MTEPQIEDLNSSLSIETLQTMLTGQHLPLFLSKRRLCNCIQWLQEGISGDRDGHNSKSQHSHNHSTEENTGSQPSDLGDLPIFLKTAPSNQKRYLSIPRGYAISTSLRYAVGCRSASAQSLGLCSLPLTHHYIRVERPCILLAASPSEETEDTATMHSSQQVI